MRTLIVEDKPYIRKGLINLLEMIDSSTEILGECGNVKEAVIVAEACKPELIFLDINLPDGNAFDFLAQTDHLNFKVIFITAYEEFALQALKYGAVDYLLKPVDIEELSKALSKVVNHSLQEQKHKIEKVKQLWSPDTNQLILSLQDSFQVIDLQELIYCETDKGYTTFYCTNDRKFMVSKTLKAYESQLAQANFTRPHQSYMVNLKYIDRYDKSGLIHLKNGKTVPVSTRKKDSFLSFFLKNR